MTIHSKIMLGILCMSLAGRADAIESSETVKSKRTLLSTIVAVGLRAAETGAGMHMLLLNSPSLVDFFSYQETIRLSQPGLADNLGNWRVFGKWRLFKCMRCFALSPAYKIHHRSLLPDGIIELLNCIPTRFVGGALTLDGLQGMWKEYQDVVEDRVARERELLFGQA